MKPGKMTDDELGAAFTNILNRMVVGSSAKDVEDVQSHIAALVAERDEARGIVTQVERELTLRGVPIECSPQVWLRVGWLANERRKAVEDRDTLCERVQALEKEAEAARERYAAALAEQLEETHAAESRLAAIRQRAESEKRMAESLPPREMERLHRAIDRVLGEDEVCAAPFTVQGNHKPGANSESTTPEPTTAEAFGTVRRGIDETEIPFPQKHVADEARAALALLERRMGELEALRDSVNAGWAEPTLTDAPRVFTLEEVKEAVRASMSEVEAMVNWEKIRLRLDSLRK